MTSKRWGTVACWLVSAGCATAGAEKKTALAAGKPSTMLVCEMERPTGSNIPTRVCRTQEIREKNRRDADELMRKGHIQIEKSN